MRGSTTSKYPRQRSWPDSLHDCTEQKFEKLKPKHACSYLRGKSEVLPAWIFGGNLYFPLFVFVKISKGILLHQKRHPGFFQNKKISEGVLLQTKEPWQMCTRIFGRKKYSLKIFSFFQFPSLSLCSNKRVTAELLLIFLHIYWPCCLSPAGKQAVAWKEEKSQDQWLSDRIKTLGLDIIE